MVNFNVCSVFCGEESAPLNQTEKIITSLAERPLFTTFEKITQNALGS